MSKTPSTIPNASKAASEVLLTPTKSNNPEEIENLGSPDIMADVEKRLGEIEQGRVELRSGAITQRSVLDAPIPSGNPNDGSGLGNQSETLWDERLKALEYEFDESNRRHEERYAELILRPQKQFPINIIRF